MKKRILVLNGPNLNLLGKREPGIYGAETLDEVNAWLLDETAGMDVELIFFQSNIEGELIEKLHFAGEENYLAVIVNPGAYGHYSIALRDAITSINVAVFEVHLSNIAAREEFRRVSIISAVCRAVVSGMGMYGYLAAIRAALFLCKEK